MIEVPLEVTEDGYTIELSLAGEPGLRFVVDTGSTGTSIDDDLARRLGITAERDLRSFNAAGPSPVRDGLSAPVEIGIGDDRWDLPVLISDLGTQQGILGLDLLKTRDVEIDARAGVLRLHPPGTCPEDGRIRTRHTWIGVLPPFVVGNSGLVRLHGTLEGQRVNGVLDLGAGGTLVNERAARRAGVDPEALPDTGVTAMASDGRTLSLVGAGFDALGLGHATWTGLHLYVGDIPPFRMVHLRRRPAVWFGGNLFADRPFWLCLPERAVWIAP